MIIKIIVVSSTVLIIIIMTRVIIIFLKNIEANLIGQTLMVRMATEWGRSCIFWTCLIALVWR